MKKLKLATGIHMFSASIAILIDRVFGLFGGSSSLGWENFGLLERELFLAITILFLAWSFWFLEE